MEVAPNRIELTELSGGYAPDPPEASLAPNQSPDVFNLLPDPGTKSAELRKGFTRLSAGRLSALAASHYIRHVNYYETYVSGARKRYLVCILTDGTSNSNNVRVYVYDLLADTFTRVDTAGRTWANPKTEHWFTIIEGTYYGGTAGEKIYSWHPTAGWNADPTTPNVKDWQDDVDDAINTATEYARDYAYPNNTIVKSGAKYYKVARGIRYKKWNVDDSYTKGELVSRKAVWGATTTYWKSFKCIKSHEATAAKAPGTGADWKTYWKKVRLTNILDDDSEITQDWFFNPLPAKTTAGVYHGTRLFLRRNDEDNRSRLQYSAPAKPERNQEIADLTWRPEDWAAVDNTRGDGGGWLDVPFSQKGDAIRALVSYGSYLLIFGRWQTYVLSGLNENSWTLRKLGDFGALGPQSAIEHQGLVYSLSAHGTLAVTDGTTQEEVPNMGVVREWLKDRIDKIMVGEDTFNWHPAVLSYGRFVWVTLPDNNGTDRTLVHDPETNSFWNTNLRILDAAVGEKGRTQRMWFSAPITGAAGQSPTLFQYKDDPGNELWTDDDWQGGASTLTDGIVWRYRAAWMQFGATRNERRIRRVWALIGNGGTQNITIDQYRNYSTSSAATTVTRALAGSPEAQFVEGKSSMADSHAVGIKVSGTSSVEVSLQGLGVDTEPRRTRYHK